MYRVLVFLVVALVAMQACTSSQVTGSFEILPTENGGAKIQSGTRDLYTLQGISLVQQQPAIDMTFGFYTNEAEVTTTTELSIQYEDESWNLYDGTRLAGSLTFTTTAAGNLQVAVALQDPQASEAIRLHFACDVQDRFWGFGEQYNYLNLRGQFVPIWVQEQGIGRTEDLEPTPPVGSKVHSYFPMPYHLDPQAGKGFLLQNSEYSSFDMCHAAADVWTVEAWTDAASFLVFNGPEALDVVSQLTAEVGRPASVPPDWAFEGVWLGAQGGTTTVTERIYAALDADIPVAAVWAQDWVGARHFGGGNFGVRYRWKHDPAWYPELAAAIADLRARGVRFLGYFNPFVLPDQDHWQTMVAEDLLIRNPQGEPYTFPIIGFTGSVVDTSNPAAEAYFKEYARAAIDLGLVGWMCDFGEWLPFDARLHSSTAPQFHNLYATQWHRWSREVLAEKLGDDFILLTRSGYTGEQKVAQVVWAGDQEAEFEEDDGLPTVLRAGISLGLAGIPYFTHDIAGFSGGPRGAELYMRWTELGAFSPIMRTHDGLQKFENVHFDSTTSVTDHFRTMAKAHKALLPYWKFWAKQAQRDGHPIVRATGLVDPSWEDGWLADQQWILGTDLLLAPVVQEHADTVDVYVPTGNWEHLPSGAIFSGPALHRVAAPVGQPAVFARTAPTPADSGSFAALQQALPQLRSLLR